MGCGRILIKTKKTQKILRFTLATYEIIYANILANKKKKIKYILVALLLTSKIDLKYFNPFNEISSMKNKKQRRKQIFCRI